MIKLKGMTWDHPRGYQPLDSSIPLAKEKFGIDVSWDRRSLKDFGDYPIDALADEYDLLIIDHPHAGFAASTGCLVALDDYLDADSLATFAQQSAGLSHASYQFEGRQWALAIDTATQVSVYRPDVFAGQFPESWDAVIQLGEQVREQGHMIAIPLCPTDAMCSFLTVNASLRDVTQIDGKPFDDVTGKIALQILRALCNISHPDSVNWNPIQLLDYMSEHGDVVYCPLTFGYTNYSRPSERPHALRFHDIPQVKGALLGGTGFAVSSRCQYPEQAVAYGAWLCSADVQKTHYVEQGGQPGNRMAWEDERANQLTGHFFRDTLQTLQQAYLRPRHQGFTVFQEQAGEVVHACLVEDSPIEDCLRDLNELYEKGLSG